MKHRPEEENLHPQEPGLRPRNIGTVGLIGAIKNKFNFRQDNGQDLDGGQHGTPIGVDEAESENLADGYKALDEIVSDENLIAYETRINKELHTPEMEQIDSLFEERDEAAKGAGDAYREKDGARQKLYEVREQELTELINGVGDDSIAKYEKLKEEQHHIRDKEVPLDIEAEHAQKLLDLLKATESKSHEKVKAPFKNYRDNNAQSWQHVDDIEVKKYLEQKEFFNTDGLAENKKMALIDAPKGETLDVPAELIVNANGFDSWLGRAEHVTKDWNSEYGAGAMSSLDVIKHYASLPTELPPVDKIRVYIQPNGKVFCDNAGGDSHRIAAAFLRGDQTIRAKSVSFIRLEHNSD